MKRRKLDKLSAKMRKMVNSLKDQTESKLREVQRDMNMHADENST